MKQKLRKLVHKGQEYLYRVNTAYNTKGDNTSLLSVRIFLSGEKNTPLCIDFITIEDEFMGQPLNGNINLLNKNTQIKDNIRQWRDVRQTTVSPCRHPLLHARAGLTGVVRAAGHSDGLPSFCRLQNRK